MTAAAEWSRAYRQRRKAGRIVLEAEADETKLVAKLIEAGLLSPLVADDRKHIDEAFQMMVNIFCGDYER